MKHLIWALVCFVLLVTTNLVMYIGVDRYWQHREATHLELYRHNLTVLEDMARHIAQGKCTGMSTTDNQ
jgi:hypothetical protein